MNPIVSVIIPCFNGAKYLEGAAESVLLQTFANLECIIVDDGSTDDTYQVSKLLINKDSRVKYVFKENGGVPSARNFGIRHASGEWVQFLDVDDWLHKDKINFQLSYLESSGCKENDIVLYSDYEVVYEDSNQNLVKRVTNTIGNLTNKQLIKRTMEWYFRPNIPLHMNSTLFKKTVFNKKMFDERFKAFGDQELFVNILLQGITFIYTPIVGMYYRVHQSNMSRNLSNIKEYYIRFLETIYKKDKSLICLNHNIGGLIKTALKEKDKNKFYRLLRIKQNPVYFLNGTAKISNTFLLKTIFLIRLFSPLSVFKKFL
ncbi:MAG: glycosyltransferase [Nitrospirae bacterium]|nr:glycosyltransferase [Nitrospirota bacterium]